MSRRKRPSIRYPILVGAKIDYETREELDIIALFDRKKVGTWIRDLIVDAVKRYQRNPQYKRFKRELEEKMKVEKQSL